MKFLQNLFKHKIISELSLVDKEIDHYRNLKDNDHKQTCLIIDEKRIDSINSKLLQLSYIKSDIETRYRKIIISKLNKFPLNTPCSDKIICNEMNISLNELQIVIYEHRSYILDNRKFFWEHKICRNEITIYNNKYTESDGIYDDGKIVIDDDEYKRVLSGWRIIMFNKNMYYEHYK